MRQRDPYQSPSGDDSRQTAAQQARELVKGIASTADGRKFLALVLDISQANCGSFSTNALQMAFNEGRRSVGLAVMNLIPLDSYQLMLKESYDRRN